MSINELGIMKYRILSESIERHKMKFRSDELNGQIAMDIKKWELRILKYRRESIVQKRQSAALSSQNYKMMWQDY